MTVYSILPLLMTDDSDYLQLQKDLDTLQRWETIKKWNFTRTNYLYLLQITKWLQTVNYIYNIYNTPIHSKSAKYLGVTLDDSLGWDPQIKSIYQKAIFTL